MPSSKTPGGRPFTRLPRLHLADEPPVDLDRQDHHPVDEAARPADALAHPLGELPRPRALRARTTRRRPRSTRGSAPRRRDRREASRDRRRASSRPGLPRGRRTRCARHDLAGAPAGHRDRAAMGELRPQLVELVGGARRPRLRSSMMRFTPARFTPSSVSAWIASRTVDVGLGVAPRVARRPLGTHQPLALVDPQGLRVHAGELGRHADDEHGALVDLRCSPLIGASVSLRSPSS